MRRAVQVVHTHAWLVGILGSVHCHLCPPWYPSLPLTPSLCDLGGWGAFHCKELQCLNESLGACYCFACASISGVIVQCVLSSYDLSPWLSLRRVRIFQLLQYSSQVAVPA